MVNIKEVAKRANVSVGTVSNTFLHPEKVASKTRDKIRGIADELGFSPNPLASALVTSRTYIIGLIASYSQNSMRGRAINEFTKAAAEYGYIVLLAVTEMDIEKEKQAVEYFIKYKVDGVVVYADYAEGKSNHFVKLVKYGIPCVVFKRYDKSYENIIVSADKAFYDLVEQLKKYNHKEIGVIAPNLYRKDGTPGVRVNRIHTFREKLRSAGLELYDDNIMEVVDESMETGEAAVDTWLATRNHLPQMFLCFYEWLAIGVQNRLLERGYKIPKDISIVAYCNSDIGHFSKPRLTAISINETDMLLEALKMLLTRIENPNALFSDYEINHTFVFEESLGPARKEI